MAVPPTPNHVPAASLPEPGTDQETELEDTDHIKRARLEKLGRLEEAGLRAFPTTFDRSHTAKEVVQGYQQMAGSQVRVAGRLGVARTLGKKLAFVFLRDGSGQVQLIVHPPELSHTSRLVWDALDPGDFVGAVGTVMTSKTGEISVEVAELTFLGKSLRNPPEKFHGISDIETRSRQRYLDLVANESSRKVFLDRTRIVSTIRRFLDAREFMEVETPILQPIPGGGAARPFATDSWALDTTLYLRIALELYLKRCIVGGFERVYEIGKNFRNEGISFKHSPEFTMLELYQAYADYQDMMVLTEQMLCAAAEAVAGRASVQRGDAVLDFSPPWRRLSLREAIRDYAGVDYAECPDTASLQAAAAGAGLTVAADWSRGKVMDELLTAFVEPRLVQPTFLVDYPTDFPGSTLAKAKPDDPGVVERFEAFAGGMEIANAFSELNDPRVQRARFEEQVRARAAGDDEAQPFDEDFLLALEHGMPPTGGLGVGIDRITMLLTDQHAIRDVILFPRLRPRAQA